MTESTSWVARMQGDGDVRFSIVVAVTGPCRSVGVRHGLRSARVAVAVCSVGRGKPSADVQNARTLERHVAVSVISFEKSMNLAS